MKRSRLHLIGAFLLATCAPAFLQGCGGHGFLGFGAGRRAAAPASVEAIAGMPFLPQEEESCGPSSLAMVLRYFGSEVTVRELAAETRTEALRGALITDLAQAARRRGFPAEVTNLDLAGLRGEIAGGTPVILLVDLGAWSYSVPHFLVVYGLTPEGAAVHSGRSAGKVVPYATLEAQWAKMGRLALVVRQAEP